MLVGLERHEQYTQDTTLVIDGTRRALSCMGDGVFRACRYHPAAHSSGVNPYPLLQYLLTAPLVVFTDHRIRHLLAWANAVAVIAATVLVVRYAARRGGPRLGFLALVAMVSSMVVPYAGSTFGEPLAMLAFVGFCLLALADRPSRWLAVTTFLAVVGKETFFPIVILYIVGFLLLSDADASSRWRKARLAGVGVVLGVAANLVFNIFRFGRIDNVQYLNQGKRPAPLAAAESFVSLLISPNGGLFWFWFMGFAAAALLAVIVVMNFVRPRPSIGRRRQLGIAAIVAGFVTGTASLALWWMPFGWYSWGPRLLVPLVPPLFLAVATVVPRLGARAWKAGLGAVVVACILLVPNYAFVFAPDTWMTHWSATVAGEPGCSSSYNIATDDGLARFHRCVMRAAWRTSSMPLIESVRGATDDDPLWYWATVTAALSGAFLFVEGVRRSDSSEGDRISRSPNDDLVAR